MICPKCGKEIDDGSVFCKFCGASLTENQEEKLNSENEVIEDKVVEEKGQENVNQKEEKKEIKKQSNGYVINTELSSGKEKKEEKDNNGYNSEKKQKDKVNSEKSENEAEKKVVINGKEQTVKPRKRHSIITFGIILAIVVVIVAIILVIMSMLSTPEKMYKKIISSFSNSFDTTLQFDSANVSVNAALSTDIEDIKDSINELNFGVNVQYDKSIEEYIGKINVAKGDDSYLNLTAMMNLLDKKLYLGEANLYDKLVCIDIPEEEANNIKIALSEQTSELSIKDDKKDIAKIVTDTINDKLNKKMFTSQKIAVNIGESDKKVKDNIFSFTYDELLNTTKSIVESLKNNEKFMAYFDDKTSIEQYLDDIVSNVEDMDEYNYEIHIYTSGLFNSVVGGAFVQIDEILEESYVTEILKQSNTQYIVKFDVISGDDRTRVLNADLTLKDVSKNELNLDADINIPDEGNILLNLQILSNYNNGIETIDVSNSINIDEMTQDDIQQIFTGLLSSPIFSEYTQISEVTDITGDDIVSDGQNYLVTFTDGKIYTNIPSTFEEIYNGNYIKSYTKENDLGYCDVDLEVEAYSEDDYLRYLESTLDYYKESGEYIDISMTNPEAVDVNGRQYKKVTLKYTYSSGSYSFPYQSDYYYTTVEDECIYSVEVSDTNGIITQNELNKFLTIEVE